jgi:hypothetical protein
VIASSPVMVFLIRIPVNLVAGSLIASERQDGVINGTQSIGGKLAFEDLFQPWRNLVAVIKHPALAIGKR